MFDKRLGISGDELGKIKRREKKQSLFSQNGKSKPHCQQPPNAHNDEKESGRDMQKIEKKKQSRKHNQPDEIELLWGKYQR